MFEQFRIRKLDISNTSVFYFVFGINPKTHILYFIFFIFLYFCIFYMFCIVCIFYRFCVFCMFCTFSIFCISYIFCIFCIFLGYYCLLLLSIPFADPSAKPFANYSRKPSATPSAKSLCKTFLKKAARFQSWRRVLVFTN